ncbi:MAG: hypothetical protein U0835_10175 [Isosphaeraceae bacterium]
MARVQVLSAGGTVLGTVAANTTGGGLSDPSNGFIAANADLTAFAGQDVRLRFSVQHGRCYPQYVRGRTSTT